MAEGETSHFAAVIELPVRLLRAWRTKEPPDWSRAADAWRTLFPQPSRAYQHAGTVRLLRLARRLDEAVDAGARYAAAAPSSPAAQLEWGRALRAAGNRPAAIDAFVSAWHLGAKEKAAIELCNYAARSALPEQQPNIWPMSDYAAFREALRTSLKSIGPLAPVSIAVSSGGHRDVRADDAEWELSVPAETVLEPHALDLLAWAAQSCRSDTIFADHDHYRHDGGAGRIFSDPVFQPLWDRIWFAEPGCAPAIVAQRRVPVYPDAPPAHLPAILGSIPFSAATAAGHVRVESPGTAISVIVPSRDNHALLARLVDTMQETAAQPEGLEWVVVDNGSSNSATLDWLSVFERQPGRKVLRFREPFNWSRSNNRGAAAASGDLLLFANDDMEMQTAGWDDRLRTSFQRWDKVGAVGARMHYPDGSYQHGGFVLGMHNGPQHEARWQPGDRTGPAGRWHATRQAAAVTGAFLCTQRTTFEAVGGFDEASFAVDFADLDYCFSVRANGEAVVYDGSIALLHHESVSRGLNLSREKRRRAMAERRCFEQKWGDAARSDPGYPMYWTRAGSSYDGLSVPSIAEVQRRFLASSGSDQWAIAESK